VRYPGNETCLDEQTNAAYRQHKNMSLPSMMGGENIRMLSMQGHKITGQHLFSIVDCVELHCPQTQMT